MDRWEEEEEEAEGGRRKEEGGRRKEEEEGRGSGRKLSDIDVTRGTCLMWTRPGFAPEWDGRSSNRHSNQQSIQLELIAIRLQEAKPGTATISPNQYAPSMAV